MSEEKGVQLSEGNSLKSVLLLDDEEGALDLVRHFFDGKPDIRLLTTKYPTQALQLAEKYFFDMVVLDVTINYNGTPFGGLELYKYLLPRYGDASLIAYSQYITDDLLRQYNYGFNFIDRHTNPIKFVDDLCALMNSLRSRQSCFVAMPFAGKFEEIGSVICKCAVSAGYRPIRVDQEHFTRSIVEKIFAQIRDAKLMVFVATDRNPNAFYECGYAVALGKEVITITDSYKNLPFDIRDRSAIAYGKELSTLDARLTERLNNLTKVEGV
jgi:hypothetical protein